MQSGNAKIMEGLFDQIFDAFCVMAVNALKTKNDVNEAVKACEGKQHAKENATMSNSDLRHAAALHFDNVLANLSKVEEFNAIFFNYLEENKLPDEWFSYLQDIKEDEPKDDLQAFIQSNYPDKAEFQQADQAKIYFGHRVFDIGKQATSEIVNVFNPLWKPKKIPSGKNVSVMCRAMKIQRFRARAHKNAFHSMRRHKLVLDGHWHDPEKKLDYMRTTVAAKLKDTDPDTEHPAFWFAFLVTSHPVYHFSKCNLALISCVPPNLAKEDNPSSSSSIYGSSQSGEKRWWRKWQRWYRKRQQW